MYVESHGLGMPIFAVPLHIFQTHSMSNKMSYLDKGSSYQAETKTTEQNVEQLVQF